MLVLVCGGQRSTSVPFLSIIHFGFGESISGNWNLPHQLSSLGHEPQGSTPVSTFPALEF